MLLAVGILTRHKQVYCLNRNNLSYMLEENIIPIINLTCEVAAFNVLIDYYIYLKYRTHAPYYI